MDLDGIVAFIFVTEFAHNQLMIDILILTLLHAYQDLNKENMKQQNTVNSPTPRRPLRRADSSYENSLEQPKDHKYALYNRCALVLIQRH